MKENCPYLATLLEARQCAAAARVGAVELLHRLHNVEAKQLAKVREVEIERGNRKRTELRGNRREKRERRERGETREGGDTEERERGERYRREG